MRKKRHASINSFTGSGGALYPFNYIQRRQRDIEVVITVITALKVALYLSKLTEYDAWHFINFILREEKDRGRCGFLL